MLSGSFKKYIFLKNMQPVLQHSSGNSKPELTMPKLKTLGLVLQERPSKEILKKDYILIHNRHFF